MQQLLLLVACILLPRAETGEIIRGHKVKPHSRPYMAYIRFSKQKKEACSGFLIKEDFVLTAARCLGSFMNVILGAHDIRQKEETQQLIHVKKPIPHPDYDKKTHVNDIMLLQLEKKAELTKAVCMLQLPKTKIPVASGKTCSVVSWGKFSRHRSTSKLHEMIMTVQKDRECEVDFPGYYKRASEMCVAYPKKKVSSFQVVAFFSLEEKRETASLRTRWGFCWSPSGDYEKVLFQKEEFATLCPIPKGDSGGPLICDNVAQGIISYERKNGTSPQIFTRILNFMLWINNTINSLQMKKSD